MNVFEPVIDQVRADRPELFHPRALKSETPRVVRVFDVTIPTEAEIDELRRERTDEEVVYDEDEPFGRRPIHEPPRGIWTQMGPESEAYEQSQEADREREPYGERSSRAGVELLAIYRPFHLYGKGHWGVLFFENNMVQFCRLLTPYFLSLGYSPAIAKKMVTYAIARHEFAHYLNELKILEMELLKGGQIFLPYLNSVYKATYPNVDCIEETVASVWQWDNNVMRAPAKLQHFWRAIIELCPAICYQKGAVLDHQAVRATEDRLLAQSSCCAVHPKSVPQVWGVLPRPYVQPWTRYENVPFMMTTSAGGKLASQLNAGPIRKTIQIYHV